MSPLYSEWELGEVGYPGDYPDPWVYDGRWFVIVSATRIMERVDNQLVDVDQSTAIKALISYVEEFDESLWYERMRGED